MIENDLSGEYEIVGSAPDVTVRQDNKYFINVCYYSRVNYGLCLFMYLFMYLFMHLFMHLFMSRFKSHWAWSLLDFINLLNRKALYD